MAIKKKSLDAELDDILSGLDLPSDEDLKKETQYKIVSAKTKIRNEVKYGTGTYIVRSPGNDLLNFYDRQNKLLGDDNRAYSAIPPSIVYHYRFEHKYPKELFDKQKNYGRLAYLRDQLKSYHGTDDNTYWGQVYSKRYDWLVNKKHKEWKFKYRKDVDAFLQKQSGQKSVHSKISPNSDKEIIEVMFWRGNLRGWSVIWIPTDFI